MGGDNSWEEGAMVVGVMMATVVMIAGSGGEGNYIDGGMCGGSEGGEV